MYPEITTSNLTPMIKELAIVMSDTSSKFIRSNSVKNRINLKKKNIPITMA
jgi:hypothetical protein